MKAIKDCRWALRITPYSNGTYYWRAWANKSGTEGITQRGVCKTKNAVKRDWEKFRKINRIKKETILTLWEMIPLLRKEGEMIRTYTIVCICNMELEVEDGDTVECPDCGRIYDDRGVICG